MTSRGSSALGASGADQAHSGHAASSLSSSTAASTAAAAAGAGPVAPPGAGEDNPFGGGGGGGGPEDESALANPYANHPQLSATEAALLYEYHKLASTMKRIQEISYPLASPVTHTALLHSMRVLERKMGLVLTLFKASVWALLVERQDAAEAEAAAAAAAAAATTSTAAPGTAPSLASQRYAQHVIV